ncbi:hypothetical protein C1645_833167 [Glomus cerebriforme]|uniref:Uncharacterized protein n=1 Tax=Glomus cerebriforme TaxID=658196 RepID=A0A397SE85_9GLOM|nr:hypothetical protein C1645_833167 [Glomus cerebriforme]
MSDLLLPCFHSHYTNQLNHLPRSIINDIWRRLTTRKYPLTVEEASGIHPEVEELLNREVNNYGKKKDRQRLKTAAIATQDGVDTLNRLYNFEQTLSEREKLLQQREQEYEKKIGQIRLEVQETESKRFHDEHEKYVDDMRKLKKKLEEHYNNKMQNISSHESDMQNFLDEKEKKIQQLTNSITLSKKDSSDIKKALSSAGKSIDKLEDKIRLLEDIILVKDNKIISLHDRLFSIVPTLTVDPTIEPKSYSSSYDKDLWNNRYSDAEIDLEIRKKYTFRIRETGYKCFPTRSLIDFNDQIAN